MLSYATNVQLQVSHQPVPLGPEVALIAGVLRDGAGGSAVSGSSFDGAG